jgi:hypothetical protein
MLRRIQHVQALPDYHLRLVYEGGSEVVVDFAPIVSEAGVFAPLADPALFAQVSLGDRGRSICWPGEIDFCADALWLQAQEARSALKAS